MGRKCNVPVDDAVAVIKDYIEYFLTDQIPAWSSDVWKDMSKALNGQWKPSCVYTNIRENRRSILSRARQEMGVILPSNQDHRNNNTIETTNNDTGQKSNDNSPNSSFNSRNEEKLDTFDLVLSEEDWNEIKPEDVKDSNCNRLQLKPKVWPNVIANEFWLQFRHPCAFVFKRAEISKFQDQSSYLIKIVGACKSKACNNTFEGHTEKKIDEKGIVFEVRTRDTRGEKHELVKRPFNGKRRKEALKEFKASGCIGWRIREALKTMRPGDIEAPILPSDDVLRQARKQGIEEELCIPKGDASDLIKTIEEMALKPQYCDLIHEVAALPFHVCYSSPAQLHTYREYNRLQKQTATIILDATGSLVKLLKRKNGINSGPIFLYVIVFNFDGTTVSTHQMLSESHDTVTIMNWLFKWLHRGAPKPKQAISDYSRALLSAMSMAFNNQTIKDYIFDRFRSVSGFSGITKKPATIIRIDVAHLIHFICRWKCFKCIRQRPIKDFFVRCVALMVECRTIKDFEEIFVLTCAVGLQTHEDAVIAIPDTKTAKKARRKLENFISVGEVTNERIQIEEKEVNSPLWQQVWESDGDTEPDVRPENTSDPDIAQWVETLVTKARTTLVAGQDLNPFYLTEFIVALARLATEFPLWTAVGMPENTTRATSSYVEGYFNNLKTRTFMGYSLPIRIDKFMAIHARDIAGSNVLMASKMVQYNDDRRNEGTPNNVKTEEKVVETHQEDADQEPLSIQEAIDSDLFAHENWRGKGTDPVYFDDTLVTMKGCMETDDQDEDKNNTFMDHTYAKSTEVENEDKGKANISADHIYMKSRSLESNQEDVSYDKFVSCLNAPAVFESTPTRVVQPPPNKKAKKQSKYFKAYPEIRQINAFAKGQNLTLRHAALLRNGSLCPGVNIAGCAYFVKNSCPFDSLVQILATAAIDDTEYLKMLERSTNNTMKFVSDFVKSGATKDLLLQRARILLEFCKTEPRGMLKGRTISCEINAKENIANVVKYTLSSNPSIIDIELCSKCDKRTFSHTTIAPNHNIITRKGFAALQEALQFQSPIYNISCREGCTGKFTRTSEPKEHIFVELDVRHRLDLKKSLECSLKDLPTTLHLGQTGQINCEYRLVGIVEHRPGHYVAHCLRIAGFWQYFNDMARNVTTSNLNTYTLPHLAVYIRTNQN